MTLVPRFHEHCESLALQLEEPPQNIWEALSQDWLFIQERSFAFRSRKQQVGATDITMADRESVCFVSQRVFVLQASYVYRLASGR